ncbi:hypothetical protein QQS21_010924 [Conoideocrella luteorostrata]|uniref:Serine protease n=1 Tax=Conoideocrella luteorostrata TaxID=1105319 RepID=A0AAJ0CE22_9HYPO|nr:hypothetical protein QQS21_010924 [Conoideocrella luteorostrata]
MVGSPVPEHLWHRGRRGGDPARERDKDPVRFGLNSVDDSVIGQASVMLRFVKTGAEKGGNGFFVNIPGQGKAVIFTAGHNLIDEHGARTTKLQAWWTGVERDRWVDIPEKDTHISKEFSSNPTEASAIDDFGIILISKNNDPPPPRTAFGFALRLAEEERIEGFCNISSYLTTAQRGETPTRSTGQFVNPILKEHQLEYLVRTEAGVSGSVVWTGYNGTPVAVAVHNYGPKRQSPKYGSRGSRIDMKMMREIMEWTGVYKRAVAILARPVGRKQPALKLPLCLSWSEEDKALRVHVQDDSGPKPVEAIFEALPVFSSAMLLGKDPREEYGFAQRDKRPGAKTDALRWISWNVEWNTASLASALSRARLARWEVKGNTAIMALNWKGAITEVVVRTDDGVVKEWDLEFPDSDYSGIAYQERAVETFKVGL